MKRVFILLIMIALSLIVVGCAGNDTPHNESSNVSSEAELSVSQEESAIDKAIKTFKNNAKWTVEGFSQDGSAIVTVTAPDLRIIYNILAKSDIDTHNLSELELFQTITEHIDNNTTLSTSTVEVAASNDKNGEDIEYEQVIDLVIREQFVEIINMRLKENGVISIATESEIDEEVFE